MFKAVIFDFDGLIIDTESAWYECYRSSLAEFHVDLPLEIFAQCIGTHDSTLDDFMMEKLGDEQKLNKIRNQSSRLHQEKMKEMDIRPGVRDYLAEADRLAIKIGLASSSNREWVEAFLDQLEIKPYFQVIKTSDDVKKVKPDPELYIQAIQALDVKPGEAIAFEDSLNGSKAAIAAGIPCVIVPNPVTEDMPFENYAVKIKSMADQPLESLLNQIAESS